MAFLSLSFDRDDTEVMLTALLDTGEFRGRCCYWCYPDEFTDLVAALSRYPLETGDPIDGQWYDGCISLRVQPIDTLGHLSVQVGLKEFGSHWNQCQSQFRANYADVDRFREQLERVIADGAGEAVFSSQ